MESFHLRRRQSDRGILDLKCKVVIGRFREECGWVVPRQPSLGGLGEEETWGSFLYV